MRSFPTLWLGCAALVGCAGAAPADAESTTPGPSDADTSGIVAEPAEPEPHDPGLEMLDTGSAEPASEPEPEEDPSETTTGPGPYGLSVAILPEAVLSKAQAKDYRLQFRIKNNTDAVVDAPWSETALLLNGRERHDWKKLKTSLPAKTIAPKETVEFIYQPSDKAVVKPGVYEFVLQVGAQKSAPAQLIVSED